MPLQAPSDLSSPLLNGSESTPAAPPIKPSDSAAALSAARRGLQDRLPNLDLDVATVGVVVADGGRPYSTDSAYSAGALMTSVLRCQLSNLALRASYHRDCCCCGELQGQRAEG